MQSVPHKCTQKQQKKKHSFCFLKGSVFLFYLYGHPKVIVTTVLVQTKSVPYVACNVNGETHFRRRDSQVGNDEPEINISLYTREVRVGYRHFHHKYSLLLAARMFYGCRRNYMCAEFKEISRSLYSFYNQLNALIDSSESLSTIAFNIAV